MIRQFQPVLDPPLPLSTLGMPMGREEAATAGPHLSDASPYGFRYLRVTRSEEVDLTGASYDPATQLYRDRTGRPVFSGAHLIQDDGGGGCTHDTTTVTQISWITYQYETRNDSAVTWDNAYDYGQDTGPDA